MADMPPYTDNPAAIISLQPSGLTLATVLSDGKVFINWEAVEQTMADPKAINREWARLLICARDGKCGPEPQR